ncbi:MAG TPA: undecaprenyldiphospho-muramoylpentapeptide beta-N-acetylglucosaminyltransferase [Longimicrobiales bacterium]|nr:undecaprenyldiphospho-muramoylpentapeptide beta-N-acetylglucosaminyltransferase [Longimicrobiales bacterium]
MSRVLFAGGGTGGHLYPALALADALQEVRPGTQVHFVGAQRGVEARVLPQRGVPHTLLPFHPVYRAQVWRNATTMMGLSRSFLGLGRLFMRFSPRLVVATGGYASAPAGLFAVAAGVPLAVQEQNSFPGLTVRMLARFAAQVHLGFPEAAQRMKPGRNTEVFALGNPIRPPAQIDRAAARARFGLSPDSTVVLIVGGSQGALALNDALLEALRAVAAGELQRPASKLEILWATGPSHIDAIGAEIERLGAADWVRAVGYIDAMNDALSSADVAVSRAGAMATAELLAWGVPMLLVPLPTAAADHQTHNAQALDAAGAALHLPQATLTGSVLWRALADLLADPARQESMRAAARGRAHPDAAREIAEQLARLLPGAA